MANSDVIVRIKADTKGYDPNIAKARRQLEGFKQENLTLGGIMKQATKSLTAYAAGFASIGAAAGAAMKVVKDAFMQSESNIDEWGRTVEGAKGAYDIFLQTLNNGNWSNFFSNLAEAIRGGRELYNLFDRLGSIKANNRVAISLAEAEIAQLRLLKQQGQDVDDKIKAATARLAALQNQGIQAGIAAGKGQALQTLRNGVNSIGGASINDATLMAAINDVARGGQGKFDLHAQRARMLEQLGSKPVTRYDALSRMFVTQDQFDIKNLTAEQQKQYAISKAITERETEIQIGLTAWSDAVSEQTRSYQQQFKNTRIALQGSGGNGGKGGKAANMVSMTLGGIPGVPVDYTAGLGGLPTTIDASPLTMLEDRLKSLTEAQNTFGRASAEAWQAYQERIDAVTEAIDVFKGKKIENAAEASAHSFQEAASAISSVGSALSQIDDPAAKVMGIVASAIGTVAQAFAQALSSDLTTKGNIWAFIGAAAAATASMITTISSIHSATGYAQGGVIPGNSFSGDNQWARVNAGETILTRGQSAIVASALSNNREQSGGVPYTTGENIYLGLTNHTRRTGQGEIVTTGMLKRMGLVN